MIKATDLRIGNYVECFGYRYVTEIRKDKLKVEHYKDGKYISEWSPLFSIGGIPLTEDILLKAGFTKINNMDSYYEKIIGNLKIYFNHKHGECEISVYGYGRRLKHIKHLHQLQNLLLSLTGEELTINF